MVEAYSFAMLAIRLVHFIGGVTWIGSMVYLGLVHLPSVKEKSENTLTLRGVSRLTNLLIITTIPSLTAGAAMALILSGLNTDILTASPWGLSIMAGGLIALAALVTTFTVVLPCLEKLSAENLQAHERDSLVARCQRWARITIILGILVLATMAAAGTGI